ncbi:hypothetical protein [Pendulispora albinea]|uniref:Uncharacterized protein n=1 Tax=Pendulispora albinea TaxID=2741071 RepID=A0ABZ2LPH7_9BACT
MSFKSALIGRVHALHWLAAPDARDVATLDREIPAARHQAGALLINLTVVPDRVGIPDGPTRKQIFKQRHLWMDNVEAVNVVILATGFQATLVRSVITELTLAMRSRFVAVFSTVDVAIQRIATKVGENPRGLRHRLDQAGITG